MVDISSHPQLSNHLILPKYRRDIDGLRAVAVISVVLFHAFPEEIKGGFIGVDIFFVISGFLISTIIFKSMEQNRFSFIEFYGRRIRRIFPALLLVLASCAAFGWFALYPHDYRVLNKHIYNGAGFMANFALWKESGYFDSAAETKPLLHLWSLGIEEQFYIVWPLLLWLAWKTRVNFLFISIVAVLISFSLNIREVNRDVAAAFYFPQTRFWELLAGSVLAYLTLHKKKNTDQTIPVNNGGSDGTNTFSRRKRVHVLLDAFLSLAGAELIAAGIYFTTKEFPFPGYWALLPIVGAVLMISAGPEALINRFLLSNRLFVGIGLISFPLYLWHWPLLSFARIAQGSTPHLKIRLSAIILAIALSWLTYKLIEKPIRFGSWRKTSTLLLLAGMFAVGSIGYVIQYNKKGLFDYIEQARIKNKGDLDFPPYFIELKQKYYPCMPEEIRRETPTLNLFSNFSRCFQSQNNEAQKMAIIGDSHAEHLFLGLAEALPRKNIVYYSKGPPPMIKYEQYDKIYRHVLNSPTIKTVILSAYWNPQSNDKNFKPNLYHTVNTLTAAKKKVYITDDVPGFSFPPQRCKYKSRFGNINICEESRQAFDKRHQIYYPVLQEIAKSNPYVKIVNISDFFCSSGSCHMAKDGFLLYRDDTHINIIGSRLLGKKIVGENPQLAD